MIDYPARPEGDKLLSAEELQALLGKAEAGGLEASCRPQNRRVLLLSKRDEDLELLIRLLAEMEVEISVTRNPFTALDYLRDRDFCGLISDFSLWTAGGALLFQRLGQLDHPVKVVFLCDRDRPSAEAAARRSGAAAVLDRPLDAAQAARVIEELLRAAPAFPLAGEGVPGPAKVEERPPGAGKPAPLAPSEPVEPVNPPAPEAELRWLRFFFEARRAFRAAPTIEERRQIVLEHFLRTQGGGAAALCSQRPPAQVRLFACGADPGCRDLLKKLFLALSEKFDQLASPSSSLDAVLIIPWRRSEEELEALLAVTPAGAAKLPSFVFEELPFLLQELDPEVR
ncbi:MAG: hypothetical protein HY717_08605 [Planctomycetes bacterium]|nr:hypothetical protein [Planctomycetota bacterium]